MQAQFSAPMIVAREESVLTIEHNVFDEVGVEFDAVAAQGGARWPAEPTGRASAHVRARWGRVRPGAVVRVTCIMVKTT
jgi:hypothetical protein